MEPYQLRLQESCTSTETTLSVSPDEVLKPVEASSDGEECPICLVQDAEALAWKETSCGHRFHERCVERWLEMKPSCPMCRCQLLIQKTVAAEQVYRPPNPQNFLHATANRYVRPPNPHILMAIEIMETDPAMFPDPHSFFTRYTSLLHE
jgi:hypothetical protein